MPKISFAKLTLSWDILTKSLAEDVSEPHIETRRRELEAALAEVRERQLRQDVLLGEAVANTRLLHEAIERGKEAEARLRAFLKGTYGGKSAQLIRYGLRPQRERRRAAAATPAHRAEPAEEEAAEAPAAAEGPVETPAPSSAPLSAGRKPAAGARRPRPGARPKRAAAKQAAGRRSGESER